ncbi:MAG: hypothetical protein AAF800_01650 [Planctomycetota bacterium]
MRDTIGYGLLGVLAWTAVGCASPRGVAPTPPERVLAERYGFSGWGEIESIRYTFNVELPGRDEPIVRGWQWQTKTGEVERVTRRNEYDLDVMIFNLNKKQDLKVGEQNQAHQQFINDSYWLLFPFQLVWSNPTVTEAGLRPLPIGEGTGRKLTAQWPAEGGYTPGDAYDLYLGGDGLIRDWVFRRGGAEGGGRAATWEDHRQLGPIVVSLEHRGPAPGSGESGFRLWFTGVEATLADGTVVAAGAMGGE